MKSGAAHSQACLLIESILAKPHNVAESSKGLKLPMCLQDRFAAISRSGRSTHPIVAMDQTMLLSAWHCGGAPPTSDFARAPRAVSTSAGTT